MQSACLRPVAVSLHERSGTVTLSCVYSELSPCSPALMMTFASDSPCRITYRSRGIPIFVYSFAFIHILRARSLFRRSFGRWRASSLNASTVADSRVFRTRGHVDFTIGTPEFRGAVTGGSPQPAW